MPHSTVKTIDQRSMGAAFPWIHQWAHGMASEARLPGQAYFLSPNTGPCLPLQWKTGEKTEVPRGCKGYCKCCWTLPILATIPQRSFTITDICVPLTTSSSSSKEIFRFWGSVLVVSSRKFLTFTKLCKIPLQVKYGTGKGKNKRHTEGHLMSRGMSSQHS